MVRQEKGPRIEGGAILKVLGSVFGITDFSFFRGFCRRCFPICGLLKCPEKSSKIIPGKILQKLYYKIPDTFLQTGRAKKGCSELAIVCAIFWRGTSEILDVRLGMDKTPLCKNPQIATGQKKARKAARPQTDFLKIVRREKTPTPKISALLRKRPFLLRANFVLTKDRNGLTTDILVAKRAGRGLVVKRPGVLSKIQMLHLVLGVGVFSLLPRKAHFLV